MTLSLIIMAVLVIVVFGFVLEPILRARRDPTILGTVELPESVSPNAAADGGSAEAVGTGTGDERPATPGRTVTEPSHAEGSS